MAAKIGKPNWTGWLDLPPNFLPLLLLYSFAIMVYGAALRLAALWNPKAKAWVDGRKNLFAELEAALSPAGRYVWMHCSSAGEFEQGKPVAETLKAAYPKHKLLITFFSPSGFAVAKNYTVADHICYLPLDTRRNAQRFLQLVKPELALFIKYEFWYHFLSAAAAKKIPLLLVSATFRPGQVFFKGYGGFFRNLLRCFRHIFVQDEPSLTLLQQAGLSYCSISGDTRFDRVAAIAENSSTLPLIADFLANKKCIVAGSTWAGDEEILREAWPEMKAAGAKLIIAPHEIDRTHLDAIRSFFPEAIFYSSLLNKEADNRDSNVLIIDNVGMLSRLYQYADVAYVGGGFTKDGIHNILEAAVWAKPVLFGPNYQKYREAGELLAAGGGFSVAAAAELKKLAGELLSNEAHRQAVGKKAKEYIEANSGATQTVLHFVQENRLLTS